MRKHRDKFPLFYYIFLSLLMAPIQSYSKINAVELTKKTTENQIRRLIEPVLDKYCHDECKLLGVEVTVDLATQEQLAPGFEDLELKKSDQIAPSSARMKLLIGDKVGPVSRTKLTELIQQYLDTLEFPVKVDTQIIHFPAPQGLEGKTAELRDKIAKQFTSIVSEIIQQFCPKRCIMADFNLQTDVVNGEEAQYGNQGEFIQDGSTAIRIKEISMALLMDESLTPEEQANILEIIRLRTNFLRNVTIQGKTLKFPKPMLTGELGNGENGKNQTTGINEKTQKTSKEQTSTAETKSNTQSDTKTESNTRQEKFERIEKIERVENGDAVQAELQKFKVFGLIFACSVIALLIFIALATFRPGGDHRQQVPTVQRIIQSLADPITAPPSALEKPSSSQKDPYELSKRYEIERLQEELSSIYAQQPKVAKQVFSRVLTEEGVETTANYIHIFGEGIVIDMLRDPSLQTDLNELMEYYAKNTIELNDNDKLELLRRLHNRTVVGKLSVIGNRSSNLFDFLAEMDGLQILELIRTESLTVKSIVLTQCDPQKRATIYSQMDPDARMQILSELSRIDYLPRDYIFNVSTALKRKRKENPKLNTEALPGSEVLVSLLERTGQTMQKTVVKNLEATHPESAQTIKSKLVSIDTLKFLRDGQLLEVVLSLKHEELIQFLKGTTNEIRSTIFSKAPKELAIELEEELVQVGAINREGYQAIERKILNRMKIMAHEGHINLVETNERMFSDQNTEPAFIQAVPGNPSQNGSQTLKKVSGW